MKVMSMQAKLSLVTGPACDLGALEGKGLAEAIAGRVARAPEGRFWSLRHDEGPRSRTYREMWDRSGQMAATLAAMALPPGSPIALMIEDGMDYIPAFWACLRSGHVAVPLTSIALEHRLNGRSRSLSEALAAAAPRVAVADGGLIATLPETASCTRIALDDLAGPDSVAENSAPADLACLLPTSGSTGAMKLVALSSRAILYRCFTTLHHALADDGVYINTFPVDSTTGFRSIALNYREYAQMPMSTIAQAPTSLLDATEMLRASSFSVTNTVAELIMSAAGEVDGRWDLSSLRQVATGSETVLPSTMRRFDQFLRRFNAAGGAIRTGYGMTETGLLVAGADPLSGDTAALHGAPLGTPAPNVAIRVVDGAGAVVPQGTVGEVEIQAPPKMFSFYWGDPEATVRGFTPDGWWRTGDTGLLCGGQLTLQGRTKDVVIFNGRKHALGAIDEAMRTVLGSQEAAFACTIPGRDGQAEALGVALVAPPGRHAAAEAAARQAVGRAFGLAVAVIRPVPSSAVPLTPTGKVKRPDLAALLSGPPPARDDAPAAIEALDPPSPAAGALALIWDAVLGPGSARDPDADYFALGGNSLGSIQLFSLVERDLGIAVEPRRFFAEPTFSTLQRLVDARPSATEEGGSAALDFWPLSPRQHRGLLIYVETWRGRRPTADRLAVGFNLAGSKPPIFLVCQVEPEVRDLARHLGPDQPVFGLRSGHGIIDHRDDEVQAFALRYVADIQSLCPTGPVLLAGICQGGIIALAMAQHLLRRGRHVPLLALMEWPTRLHPYPGRVLFIYGEDSRLYNPYLHFREPARGWRRHHAEVETVIVPGDHWWFLQPEGMPESAAILAERFDRALRLPALHLADEHRRAEIDLGPLPSRIDAGRTFTVKVGVTNASATPWTETSSSGLMLAYHWVDDAGTVVGSRHGRAALPAMAPNVPESVRVAMTAPSVVGRLTLVVDVVEEGSVWFGTLHAEGTARAHVDIVAQGPSAVGRTVAVFAGRPVAVSWSDGGCDTASG